ncbi:MAG: aminoglycoside phosphotransferase family protein, partial [Actinobacteria bacterium]|nr:aminoglycoside phosphotransferase family protein [Actinomycetota bacterium]NIS36824.1 aminoglycoside phosphotransferase family protein [Actinomycetota bacterium]NIU22574.1 aminoglycoside phosphotransferase family protein [Actinomycetota bacterium]NIU71312.1 aminoglycoside phosphotransferase family protein [Actinomycetota bacterium]NIW33264.1 phosphotransferase [Actinomycetota bacterium]
VAAFERARDAVAAAIDRYEPPLRIVHGDLNPWNVMATASGLAVIDFEDVMWAHPIQDIATSLYYFDGRPEWDEASRSFRAGYEEEAPWPE